MVHKSTSISKTNNYLSQEKREHMSIEIQLALTRKTRAYVGRNPDYGFR